MNTSDLPAPTGIVNVLVVDGWHFALMLPLMADDTRAGKLYLLHYEAKPTEAEAQLAGCIGILWPAEVRSAFEPGLN